MDNRTIAQVFSEIADVLEIKGANPFKIRAYRNAADLISHTAQRVADLTDNDLRALPGIGKDLAARIRELVETGELAYHRELVTEFPPSILDLLKLQGVGPKTVALVYSALHVRTLDELEQAARAGEVRTLRGLGPKKEEALLRAIEQLKRREGRHLIVDAERVASTLVTYLQASVPEAVLVPVGSLRRGCDTCGDIDLVAYRADPSLLDRLTEYAPVSRVLGKGDTKASVLINDGFQADLRLVPPESAGAALQYFTGSKAHNITLRDRALERGLKLNEYGVFRNEDDQRVAGETEDEIYQVLGLTFVPPELRENRGEIEAAARGVLPQLVERGDLRGDLHSHTTATDGRADIETMALAARAAGLEYLAITDHSQALAMAGGLDEHRALEQAAEIRRISQQMSGITLLAGIECDIRPDGTLDLSDECLAQLDVVVASVHSAFAQDETQMTDRLLRAMESPFVDIIGHPTGRLLLRRDPYRVNVERLVEAAARHGVALEINCQVDRLDLSDINAKLARDRGVNIVISTDAHAPSGFDLLRWGVVVARRAWLGPDDVLNTRPVEAFRAALRRNRGR